MGWPIPLSCDVRIDKPWKIGSSPCAVSWENNNDDHAQMYHEDTKPPIHLLQQQQQNFKNNLAAAAAAAAAAASSSFSPLGGSGSTDMDSDNSSIARKRRKQTHVPESNKDERYWARRLKNNEAAKRSRDMRIKREKIVFEENSRLEKMVGDLKTDLDRMATENKELHLKMDLVLEENNRLKSVLLRYQSRRDEDARRRPSQEVDGATDLIHHSHRHSPPQHAVEQRPHSRSPPPVSRPFPFPE